MGLFDNLIKEGAKALKEATSEENKEKASNLFNSFKQNIEDVTSNVLSDEDKEKASSFFNNLKESLNSKSNSEKQMEQKPEYFEEDESDERTCREKVLTVLQEEFAEYEVRENVSPLTIGGQGKFMNYSIGVYKDNVPKLFIMLIGKTTASHREYRWSRQEAEKNGIEFINFINHYPNTIPYITDRLHKYL